MGLFSKIAGGIISNLGKADDVESIVDKAANVVNSAKEIGAKIDNAQTKSTIKNIDSLQRKLKDFEGKVDAQFNIAYGKNYEEKIQVQDEHLININYTVACKYNTIHYAGNNLYVAGLYDKYGVISPNDEIIIPFDYDFICSYSEEKFCVCKDGKWGYIDINNNVVIDFCFTDAFDFSEGLASASMVCDDGKEQYGYIDNSGNFVIPCKYDYAEPFNKNGLACVGFIDTWGDIRKGVIDKQNNTIVNCRYAIIKVEESYILYCLESFHSPKFFDLKGNPIEMEESKELTPENTIIPYWNSEIKYGYYIHTDNGDFCKIKPIFDLAEKINEYGNAIVSRDGLYGIIKIS